VKRRAAFKASRVDASARGNAALNDRPAAAARSLPLSRADDASTRANLTHRKTLDIAVELFRREQSAKSQLRAL
jgi:hypothetical protein